MKLLRPAAILGGIILIEFTAGLVTGQVASLYPKNADVIVQGAGIDFGLGIPFLYGMYKILDSTLSILDGARQSPHKNGHYSP